MEIYWNVKYLILSNVVTYCPHNVGCVLLVVLCMINHSVSSDRFHQILVLMSKLIWIRLHYRLTVFYDFRSNALLILNGRVAITLIVFATLK